MGHHFTKPTGPYWVKGPDFVDFITWSDNRDCRFSYHFKTSFCVRNHCLILNRNTWSTLLLYSDYNSLWMLFSFWTSKNPGKALEKTVKQPWKALDFWISEDVRTLGNNCFSINPTSEYHFQKSFIFIWISSKKREHFVQAVSHMNTKNDYGWIVTFLPIRSREKWYSFVKFILITFWQWSEHSISMYLKVIFFL